MTIPKTAFSIADEAMRIVNGSHSPFDLGAPIGNQIDKSLREAVGLRDLASGSVSASSAIDKALLGAISATDPISKIAEGDLGCRAMRDIVDAQSGTVSALVGRSDPFSDAVRGIKGFADPAFAGVRTGLDKFDIASAGLLDELAKSQSRDPFGVSDNYPALPELPPIPPNPIHETNELLDLMVDRLSEQQALIEASAEAQKRETELLGQLVQAFTASQAESEKATRHAQMQAWIAIAVAILTGVAPLLIVLFSAH